VGPVDQSHGVVRIVTDGFAVIGDCAVELAELLKLIGALPIDLGKRRALKRAAFDQPGAGRYAQLGIAARIKVGFLRERRCAADAEDKSGKH
jgi:hypothetical protein